jgi:type IV conjugative transfer system protein TraE
MDYQTYNDELTKVKQHNKWLLCLGGFMMLLNLLLTITTVSFSHRQMAVLVPMNLKTSAKVSTQSYSANYLTTVADAFVSLRLNFTPDSIIQNQALIERFIAPDNYADLVKTLHDEAKQVISEHIASSFAITSHTVDASHQWVRVSGILTRSVGEKALPPVKTTFQLGFANHSGLIEITSFDEVRKDA